MAMEEESALLAEEQLIEDEKSVVLRELKNVIQYCEEMTGAPIINGIHDIATLLQDNDAIEHKARDMLLVLSGQTSMIERKSRSEKAKEDLVEKMIVKDEDVEWLENVNKIFEQCLNGLKEKQNLFLTLDEINDSLKPTPNLFETFRSLKQDCGLESFVQAFDNSIWVKSKICLLNLAHCIFNHKFDQALTVLKIFNSDMEQYIRLHDELSLGRTAPIVSQPDESPNGFWKRNKRCLMITGLLVLPLGIYGLYYLLTHINHPLQSKYRNITIPCVFYGSSTQPK